jgi:hypothetical protein
MEYRHPGSPSVKKFRALPSAKKIMLTIFWDARGVLYTEFLTKGSKVNSDKYCATLQSLKQRIRKIRPERNTLLLHHDNARPHFVVGLAGRPRPQHDYHHDTKVQPEAATAVIELLMMGGKTPETC